MNLSACTEVIRTKVGNDCGLNALLKFDCGSDGVVFVDAITVPNSVSNEDREASCTVTLALENLSALLSGDLNPVAGFMTGKLKVAGDMSVAMRLQKVV